MRIYYLVLVSLCCMAFSCQNSTNSSDTLTEEEKAKMYNDAEERARKNIEEKTEAKSFAEIAGKWSKVKSQACTDNFPNTIQFSTDGSFSSSDNSGSDLQWAEGKYNIANDEEITFTNTESESSSFQYRYFTKMAMITIHLSEDCTLLYKKNI